jgi:glycosyltransferase involved in cell wall biosynthesis
MNIALVCDYSLDYLGGAQTAFIQQVRAMTDAGHRVLVIAPRGRTADIGASAHEWFDTPFTVPGIGLPFLRNTDQVRAKVSQALARHRIEVVHVHSEFGLAAACIDVAAQLRVRVVHTVHTFFWRARLPVGVDRVAAAAIRSLHGWLTGQPAPDGILAESHAESALRGMTLSTALRADAVVSPSEHQRERLAAAGVRTVVTIANTTAASWAERPAALAQIEGPLKVLWIGRCAPEKRLLVFIAACIEALGAVPVGRLEVEVVGEGPELARARRAAAGHPEILFSGRVASDEVMAKLDGSHVVALTSSGFDNQPMVVVEAMYAARPVLYVDPLLREGLDTAGLLCADDSAQAIAAMLVQLVHDPHRVVRVSERAGLAFDRFAPDHFVAEIEDVYRRLVPGVERSRPLFASVTA